MKRRWAVLVFAVLVVAGVAWAGRAWWEARSRVSTDDAYVESTIAPISAKVPGQIAEVRIRDNQRVEPGQVLVRLDGRDYRARVAQARAAVLIAERRHGAAVERVRLGREMAATQMTQAEAASMRAEAAKHSARSVLEVARAAVQARQSALASAAAERDRARVLRDRTAQDLARARELFEKELVARQFVDHADAEARAADAQLVASEERVIQAGRDLESAEAEFRMREAGFEPQQLGLRTAEARMVDARAQALHAEALVQEVKVREAERDLAQAELRQAQADLALAELNLEYTEVRAPIAGLIAKKAVEVGQVVQAGQPLAAVVALHDLWVLANFKETQLKGVRPGMRASVVVDSFPDRTYPGVVESISAGTGSRFSLLPPENATGNWVKVVQRVPVKVMLDPKAVSNPHTLRAGMSAFVTIHFE